MKLLRKAKKPMTGKEITEKIGMNQSPSLSRLVKQEEIIIVSKGETWLGNPKTPYQYKIK